MTPELDGLLATLAILEVVTLDDHAGLHEWGEEAPCDVCVFYDTLTPAQYRRLVHYNWLALGVSP